MFQGSVDEIQKFDINVETDDTKVQENLLPLKDVSKGRPQFLLD